MDGRVLFSEPASDFGLALYLLFGVFDEGSGLGEGVGVVGKEFILLEFGIL